MESCSVLASSEARSRAAYEPGKAQDLLYQYSSIGTTKGTIRLLVIRGGTGNEIDCELVDSTLDEHGLPFEAVSYTWGPEFVANSVRIGGRRLPVTFHLSLILRDLRLPDADRIIWVDAVCINQQDAIEKGHQVAHMKDIYRCAKCVLFCICRPTDYTDLLMDALAKLQMNLPDKMLSDSHALDVSWRDLQAAKARPQHMDPQSPEFEPTLHRQVEALMALQRQGLDYILNQPWFNRVWILQEVANASSAIVYCGRRSVSAAIFALSPQILNAPIPFGQDGFVAEVLGLMSRPSRRDRFQDLYPLLQRFRGSQASVERDKIYALFGMCQDIHIETRLNPNYVKSERDVVHDTISYICRVEVSAVASSSPINSISELLASLDDLDNTMLSHFLYSNDHSSAVSLLVHRGEYISVDAEMFDLASTDMMIKEGVVELLLQQRNADTLLSGWGTWTTTYVAAQYGHDALAKSMLAKVSDLEIPWVESPGGMRWRFPEATGGIADLVTLLHSTTQGTRLYQAATCGNINLVALLLKAGASLDDRGDWYKSPLTSAAENGHIGIVKLLMDNGADLNPQGIGTLTPLSAAANNGQEAVVKFLLKSGAYFSLADDQQGSQPLRMAATNGQEAVARTLLEAGANDNYIDPAVLNSALGNAVWNCHPSTLRLLLDTGATLGAEDLSELLKSVLESHAFARREDGSQELLEKQEIMARMLLEKGAQSGQALCLATSVGSERMVQLLLEHGPHEININQELVRDMGYGKPEDIEGTPLAFAAENIEGTPLAFAAERGDEDMVNLLLANGANPNIQNSKGETPISWAERDERWNIVRIFLSEGVELETEGVDESTGLVDDYQRT